MEIGGVPVDDSNSVFFIAEAGVNHNGDLDMARDLVDVAAESGADAVKFQTFVADRLVTKSAPKAEYQEQTAEADSQYEMLKKYELDRETHEILIDRCEERNITFLSTPFDPVSANLLDEFGVAAIKLGSGELDNHPLLKHVAKFGRPMIVSTGMGTMQEVHEAYASINDVDPNVDIAFLHCTSAYPTELSDVNLRAMQSMLDEFSVPIGYSDHTTEVETPGIAVGAGATIIEKHFTLDKSLPGPDHQASLNPDELDRAITIARNAATARGHPEKRPTKIEEDNRRIIRKSLHAATSIEKGEVFTEENVKINRPADGLSPKQLSAVLGRTARSNLDRGMAITDESVGD